MPITDAQMRSLVLDVIRQPFNPQQPPQSEIALYRKVEMLAAQRKLPVGPPQHWQNATGYANVSSPGDAHLTDAEALQVNDIFYDLLVEGIVRPGFDKCNPRLPHYHVTAMGREMLAGAMPSPFDPEGYLSKIKKEIPAVDDVIITYLTESLKTFRIGCYLASTVTLGCASEKALLLLVEACANSLPSPSDDAFRKKTDGRQIKSQFEEFHKMLIGKIRGKLPKDVDDLLDVQLAGIFDIIRNQRNAAGHPTGSVIQQSDAHGNLYAFPIFLQKIYAVIDWLAVNKL